MMTTISPETSINSVTHLRAALTRLSKAGRTLDCLSEHLAAKEIDSIDRDFFALAHVHQEPPAATRSGEPWTTWLVLGGRGAGKTRLGAEWVRAIAHGESPCADRAHRRIALVGESEHDVREVMIEGASGLLRISPRSQRPVWISSRRRLEWPNGAVAEAFSAEDPESLRGPQFEAAWCDEFAKWRHAEATFDMLQFGLRLGERPRQVITTTPRPIPLLKRLAADVHSVVTHAPTQANARFLSPAFLDTVLARYAGTRLGRQEIDGEIIEDRPDGLWTRALIESCRIATAPPLARIVVAVDPPASTSRRADACGLVAAGRAEDGCVHVIADDTVSGLSPAGWAAKAIVLWRRLCADALVVEVNQGGDMVRAVIAEADPTVPVQPVRARRSKWLRAEPVAALYEQGRVKHVGAFPALEDEMCDFGLDGLSSGRSPDRLDALVWAVSSLSFAGGRHGPRVRGL
jgi:phage terminase large subunit-like protein